jgi:hypothetical protein
VVSAFVAGDDGLLPLLRQLRLLRPPPRPFAFAGVGLPEPVVGPRLLVAVDVGGVHVPRCLLRQPCQRHPRHRVEVRDVVEVAVAVVAVDADGADVLTILPPPPGQLPPRVRAEVGGVVEAVVAVAAAVGVGDVDAPTILPRQPTRPLLRDHVGIMWEDKAKALLTDRNVAPSLSC